MKRLLPPIAIALGVAIFIQVTSGDVFQPSLDEGIYLEGGHRVLLGQQPYRDFFAFTGPLIYWVGAVLERCFGRDLAMLRLSMSLSIGMLAGAVFAVVNRRAGWRAAAPATALFLTVILVLPNRLVINHRWISAALLAAAVVVALEGIDQRRLSIAAGGLAALAAWATPSFAPAIVLLAIPMTARLNFMAGVAAVSLPIVGWLVMQDALGPMIKAMSWASREYAAANSVPFAYNPTGAWRPYLAVGMIVIGIVLGVVEAIRTREKRDVLLAMAAVGCFLTSYPRWDVMQLPYVLALPVAITGAWVQRRMPSPLAGALAVITLVGSAALIQPYLSARGALTYFPTRAGYLRGDPSHGQALEALERRIPARAPLAVFPYFPLIRYMLAAENPSSFSFLQPGMMTESDEGKVVGELTARPPRYFLRQTLPREDVLFAWPNSDPSRLEFRALDAFVEERYRPVERVRSRHFELQLYELKESSIP